LTCINVAEESATCIYRVAVKLDEAGYIDIYIYIYIYRERERESERDHTGFTSYIRPENS
jgi:hypothetical protein